MLRTTFAVLVLLASSCFASAQETQEADESIREVIAILKNRLGKIKNKADVERINVAVRALESVISKNLVTRENFLKFKDNQDLTIKQAEAILGPGKLVFSNARASTYEWRSDPAYSPNRRRVIITLTIRNTFVGGVLDSKSIID